jgi:hypothetical protein
VRRLVAAASAGLFLVCCYLAPGGLRDDHPYGDVHLYAHYARLMDAGQWPYRDFFDEYPPLAQPLFLVVRWLPGPYAPGFKWTMAICGAVAVALMTLFARRRPWLAGLAAGVAPLAVGKIFLNAYDLWPALLLAAALLALVRKRDSLGFVLLALAVAAKVYPLAVLPLAVIWTWPRRTAVRGLAWFAGVLIAVHLPFLATGAGGLRFSYWVQVKRGLQVESLAASLLLAADRLGLYHATLRDQAPGSKNVLGPLPHALATVTSLVQVAAILVVTWIFLRRRADLVAAAAAVVVGFVAFAKVLSPQYVDWLVPLVPAAGAGAATLTLGACLLTQVLFDHYLAVYARHDEVWILVARNVLLVALYALLVVRMRRTSRT